MTGSTDVRKHGIVLRWCEYTGIWSLMTVKGDSALVGLCL